MSKYLNIFLISLIFIYFVPICFSEEENVTFNDTFNGEIQNETEENQNYKMPDPFDNYSLANIITLDDSNYTEEIKKNDTLYLLIYASWCGHCEAFIPHYVETANYCKEKNLDIKFARIDGNKNMNASSDFGISGYPSIFFLYKGERHVFNGPRDKEGLLYFMKRKMSDDVIKINKLEELKNIKNIFNTSLILLTTVKKQDEMINKSFRDLAKKALYIDFVSCLSKECYDKYGEDVILFKKFDEKENRYFASYGRIEEAKMESIFNFTGLYAIEPGAFVTGQDITMALEHKKKIVFYIRNSSLPEHTKYDKLIKEIGLEYRIYDICTFVSSAGDVQLHSNLMNAFSLLPEELPGLFYYDAFTNDQTVKVKLYSKRKIDLKKLNKNFVDQFVKDVKSGKIRRDLFSENVQENIFIRGMKYVTGKSFDEDITDEKKNVFLCMIEGYESDAENDFVNIFGNLTKKYQNDTEKNLKFVIMNINNNEPRDLIAPDDYDFPRAYLFTNAMEKKETIRFMPKNISEVVYDEFEEFLSEKLNWKSKSGTDTVKNEEKKEGKKDKIKTEDL
jgi:thiol-disulfide isomerase/thioredoxin